MFGDNRVMRRIAVTGGIAEGKSTVAGYLKDLGYSVASSDEVGREVFRTESVQHALAKLLGVAAPVDPALVRARLDDPAIRRSVNAITHPEIVRRIRSDRAEVFEIPLLVETCLQGEFDRVWVVTCGEEEQLRRLTVRLGNSDEARKQIATQLPTRAKIAFADSVIRTNRGESSVMRSVAEAALRDLDR